MKSNTHQNFAVQNVGGLGWAGHMIYDVFLVSFFGYLFIFFIESINRGFVAAYVNVDYLLAVCAISGLASLLFEEPKAIHSKPRAVILCLFIAALVSFGIYGYVENISGFAPLFAIASGLIVFLSCYLMLHVEKEQTSSH